MEANRNGRLAAAKPGSEISVVLNVAAPRVIKSCPLADIHSSEIHIKMLIWIWLSQGKGRIA